MKYFYRSVLGGGFEIRELLTTIGNHKHYSYVRGPGALQQARELCHRLNTE